MASLDITKFKRYNEKYLTERYYEKNERNKRRLLPFNFTLQQWLDFHKVLYSGVRCAYLNQKFSFIDGHDFFPTIERLNDLLPYSPENCVWVCHFSNQMKNEIVKGKTSDQYEDERHKNYAKRIEKLVANKEMLEIIQEPYKHLFQYKQEEKILEQNITTTPINQEIVIATLFASFGNFIENTCESEYLLTYNEYKKLILRKKCQLTGRQLLEDLSQIGLFVVDKSKSVCKDNIIVTTKEVQNALDTMIVSSKLSLKELKMLCNVIGESR